VKVKVKVTTYRLLETRVSELVAEGPAAAALGKRIASADSVRDIMVPLLADLAVEQFWAILLNGKHHVQGLTMVSQGSLANSIVHPREVFGVAVREGAAAVIAVHNHPSGDPEPSAEDIEVTRRLQGAGKLLGIPLLDHVVIGCGKDRRYVSLRERISFE
jgi:DNA repair protein RadC